MPQRLTLKDLMAHAGAFTGDVSTLPKELSVGDAAKMLPMLQSSYHPGYTGDITSSVHPGQQGDATTGKLPPGYDPSQDYNGFLHSQCTSYASWYWSNVLGKKFVDVGGGANGNAGNWPEIAKAQGYTVSETPVAGDIVSWPGMGQYGHVAIVQGVNPDGTINVSEMNYVPGKYTTRQNVSSKGAQFIR